MRYALDANLLLYGEGIDGRGRVEAARELLEKLPRLDGVIAVQALGEIYNVLVRKGRRTRIEALEAAQSWAERFSAVGTTAEIMEHALRLATVHPMSIWDAVQLAAAAESGCELFLSEDLQHGFAWRGVTVVNPFAAPRHPLLGKLFGRA